MRKRALPYDAEAARKHIVKRDPVMRDIVKRVGPFELEVARRAVRVAAARDPVSAARGRRPQRRSSGASSRLFGDRIPQPHELAAVTDEDAARGGRLAPEGRLHAQPRRALRSPACSTTGALRRATRRRRHRSGDADQGHRPLDGGHAAAVLPGPAGCAARRRPRRPQLDAAGVRARRAADAGADGGDRRAVAAVPQRRHVVLWRRSDIVTL